MCNSIRLSVIVKEKNKAKANVTKAGIPLKDLEAKMVNYCITDGMGALTLAMEIEEKAYNMYRKFSQNAADTNAQVVCEEPCGRDHREFYIT